MLDQLVWVLRLDDRSQCLEDVLLKGGRRRRVRSVTRDQRIEDKRGKKTHVEVLLDLPRSRGQLVPLDKVMLDGLDEERVHLGVGRQVAGLERFDRLWWREWYEIGRQMGERRVRKGRGRPAS